MKYIKRRACLKSILNINKEFFCPLQIVRVKNYVCNALINRERWYDMFACICSPITVYISTWVSVTSIYEL